MYGALRTQASELTSRGGLKFALLIAITVEALCWSVSYAQADDPDAPDTTTSGALTEAERNAYDSELQKLQERLAVVRANPAVTTDHWADVNLFIKAVVWAIDFGPINDCKDRELLKRGLHRAQERIERLAAGEPTWADKKGRIIRGFVSEVDGSTQPYGLIIPSGYDPTKPARLDVVLHGSTGVRGDGITELKFVVARDGGDVDEPHAPDVNFIELQPMGRLGENSYRFEGETDVDEAIAAVCRNYRIEQTRMVLRGSSLGGVGTWQIGLKRPDRFVALGPTAGPVDTYEFAGAPWPHFVPLEPLTPWQEKMLHLVDAIDYTANAGMVPVIAVMGDKDPYFSSHLLMKDAFEKEGIPFLGFVDHGAGHGVSAKARQQQLSLLGEFADKGRDSRPVHIHFTTWTLKFSRCHWMEILGLQEHYQRATIDVRMAGDGSVIVSDLENITRFAVGLMPRRSLATTLTVDGTEITVPVGPTEIARTVVVEQENGSWSYQGDREQVTLTGKRPGLQGPIDDAFATPFMCVRGTGTAWNPAVHAWAEANLIRFADEWRRHYRGELPCKNDADVTADDIRRYNLVLFGDPGSNQWIKEVLAKLPVQWTCEEILLGDERYAAVDHGLQLIFPNPLSGGEGRYVVFNSGHTYHDAELRFSYMVFPRLGDWAVMRVGKNPPQTPVNDVAETVLESGFFDEAWKLP